MRRSKYNLQLILILFIWFLTILLLFNCGKKHNPLTSSEVKFPSAPQNLKIFVGDGEIELTWVIKENQNILKYFVYRKDSEEEKLVLRDSVEINKYIDRDLTNGRNYSYQISAINTSRVEGPLSRSIGVVPNVFDVIIENGKEYINSKNVTLSLTAPEGTQLMKTSNDSLFNNTSWEPFSNTKNWELSNDDGIKYVYVKFRDQNGNETLKAVNDKIILDTKATIFNVEENSNGATLTQGDNLHIIVNTKESGGEAKFDIGDVKIGIHLYDDGENGDENKDDGIYELDYIIPAGFEIENAEIKSHFEDVAGNSAESVSALSKITIQETPKAITLFVPTPINDSYSSLNISWSMNSDSDFSMYKIFRSKLSNVTTSSTLVTTIEDRNVTNYNDENLKENTTYYYKIYVFDTGGLFTSSNEVLGTTNQNEPPVVVTLYNPGVIKTDITLSWTENSDNDFSSYKIFRAETPGISITSQLIEVITERNITLFTDEDLDEGKEYYYKVIVFDEGGNYSESNEVIALTEANEPPESIDLFNPTDLTQSSVKLSWTQSSESDFASYRIFRSTEPGVTNTSQFVTIIVDPTVTFFTDSGLDDNTLYYYKIYIYDTSGKFSESNEVGVTTLKNLAPDVVILSQPTLIDSASIRLSWSQSLEDDFASYRLFRSKSSPVDTSNAPIAVINDATNTEYNDRGLDKNTEYFFILRVYDNAGLSSLSNEVHIKTR